MCFLLGLCFGLVGGRRKIRVEVGLAGEGEVEKGLVEQDCEIGEVSRNFEEVKLRFGFYRPL